jgi:hypothetical protein
MAYDTITTAIIAAAPAGTAVTALTIVVFNANLPLSSPLLLPLLLTIVLPSLPHFSPPLWLIVLYHLTIFVRHQFK